MKLECDIFTYHFEPEGRYYFIRTPKGLLYEEPCEECVDYWRSKDRDFARDKCIELSRKATLLKSA